MAMEISAADFKIMVEQGHFERLERATVLGEVSYRGETIPQSLRLLYVTFLGPVYFTDAQVKGTLDLTGCQFTRTLSLANAQIDGSLFLNDVAVDAIASLATPTPNHWPVGNNYDWNVVQSPLAANGLAVRGSIEAHALRVSGHLEMPHIRVDGDFRLSGFHVQGTLTLGGSEIRGNCSLSAGQRGSITGPSHVAGRVDAPNLRLFGNLILSGVVVQDDCQFWSADIRGNLWVACAGNDRDPSQAVRTSIGGEFHLAASKIRGHVSFEGVTIEKSLRLYSSEIGPLRIHPARGSHTGPHRYSGCQLGALFAHGLTVHGDAQVYGVTVTGLSAGNEASVSFANSRIGSHLRFWSAAQFVEERASQADEHAPDAETRGSLIVGDLNLTEIKIDGECDLTNMSIDGSLLLDDSEVRGDVFCRSAVSLLQDFSIRARGGDLYGRLLQAAASGRKPKTSVRRMSLITMRCHNDVDLSGLELRATDAEVAGHSGFGNLEAHGIKVAGDLWMYRRVDDRLWQEIKPKGDEADALDFEVDASIAGRADFSGAEIGHLSISGSSFQKRIAASEDTDSAERERGLILSGAKIDELEIRPLPLEKFESPFPVPVNFADIEVRLWKLHENDKTRYRRYCELLESDIVTRRSTYMAVERNLRNRGHESEADQIYRAMMRRVSAENWQLIRAPSRIEIIFILVIELLTGGIMYYFQYPPIWIAVAMAAAVPVLRTAYFLFRKIVWDWLLGFGTTPIRIGVVILILFAVSVALIYGDKRNIAPTLTAAIANKSVVAGAAPPPADNVSPARWNWWDAIAIGLRTHVPLTSWAVRDEWQLADDADRKLYVAGWEVGWGRPEDYGIVMMVLNFVAWPPFLAFALRRAFRYA